MTDRRIAYQFAVPTEKDILATNLYGMIGDGMLALDLIGSATQAAGLPCTPTSPASLNIAIGPGRIYSLQDVDDTAYSSLGILTSTQILKQGIMQNALQLACAAPSTVGFSINYLIEAAYLDIDGNTQVIPYYNQSSPPGTVPLEAWNGPNNSGTPQPTARLGTVSMRAKAGIAALTGTQTTPGADAGYVGLYIVTVAFGQT